MWTVPGGKKSKLRITVALCASMEGEKLQPLVIGKASQPRCLQKINAASLPVTYRNNKKAWMTSDIYEEFLHRLDRQMQRKQRHILLFVDNAPSHPFVRVKFLPPNTTAYTHPMHQGIIQATKLKFRKRQVSY